MKYTFLNQYRTTNKWAEQAIYLDQQGGASVGMQSLENYLDQPRFSGLKYRYYATPGNAEYQKTYRNVPMKNILDFANTMMRPLFTDFTEVSENKEFAKISGQFYYELFVQEYLFVSYNVFEKAEAIVVNPDEQKNKRLVELIRKRGGFDLWVKLDEDYFSENVQFMHIESGLVVKFPEWTETLAWVR